MVNRLKTLPRSGYDTKAQGCRASRLPWELRKKLPNPNRVVAAPRGATPLGLRASCKFPQGSREARQPWAVLHNRCAVLRLKSAACSEVFEIQFPAVLLDRCEQLIAVQFIGRPPVVSDHLFQ